MSGEPRKGTFKVEFLKDIEKKIQARWEENNAYEENAPEDMKQEKFMVTFQIHFSLICLNDLKMTEKAFSAIGCSINIFFCNRGLKKHLSGYSLSMVWISECRILHHLY